MCLGLQKLFLLHWISQVGLAKSQQDCWAVHRILFLGRGERQKSILIWLRCICSSQHKITPEHISIKNMPEIFHLCFFLFVCFVFKSALNATSVIKRTHSRLRNEDEEESVDSSDTVRQVLNPNSRKQKQSAAKSLVLLKIKYSLYKVLNVMRKCGLEGICGSHCRANTKV